MGGRDVSFEAMQLDAVWNDGDAKRHTCAEDDTCTCSIVALEPDEHCPTHGYGEWPPRCATCGRYMQREDAK